MFGRKKTKDQPLTSSYTETEEGVIIRLSGRLDSVSSAEFQEEAVQKCRGRSTTLDMEEVTYLSSAGLRAILALDKAVGRNNKLSVINAKDAVKDVLDPRHVRIQRVHLIRQPRNDSSGRGWVAPIPKRRLKPPRTYEEPRS